MQKPEHNRLTLRLLVPNRLKIPHNTSPAQVDEDGPATVNFNIHKNGRHK